MTAELADLRKQLSKQKCMAEDVDQNFKYSDLSVV